MDLAEGRGGEGRRLELGEELGRRRTEILLDRLDDGLGVERLARALELGDDVADLGRQVIDVHRDGLPDFLGKPLHAAQGGDELHGHLALRLADIAAAEAVGRPGHEGAADAGAERRQAAEPAQPGARNRFGHLSI